MRALATEDEVREIRACVGLVAGARAHELVRPVTESYPYFNPSIEFDRLQAAVLTHGRGEDLGHE